MARFRVALAIVVVVPLVSLYAGADGASPVLSLDGKSFEGRIRGTGLFTLVGSQATIRFANGTFSWTTGSDYEPAPYETTAGNGSIVFTARAAGKRGGAYVDDYVDWSGSYDGRSLTDVTAVWTRSEGGGDWLHDLLLPEVVTFVFEPR